MSAARENLKELGLRAEREDVEPSQTPATATNTCRLCGGPAGPSEECPRCEAEISAYITSLVDEPRASEQVAESEIDLEAIARPPEVAAPERSAALDEVVEAGEVAELEAIAKPHEIVEAEEIAETETEIEEPVEAFVEYEALVEPGPEAEADGPPSPPHAPARRSSAAPRRRRGWRLLIAAVALGGLATAGSLAVSQGDPGGPSATPAPSEQVAERPDPSPSPAAPAPAEDPPGFGNWSGQVRVVYEDGTRDEMDVALRIGVLEPGKMVGTSTARQNGTECRGSLTSLGRLDGVFRFAYREQNTAECIAKGRVNLTLLSEDRLAYEEITSASVNRGILTRD